VNDRGRARAAGVAAARAPAGVGAARRRRDARTARSPRASWAPSSRRRPRATSGGGWTVEPRPARRAWTRRSSRRRTLSATVAWVPDAPGAGVLVVAATRPDGSPVAVAARCRGRGGRRRGVVHYDATRSLGRVVRLRGRPTCSRASARRSCARVVSRAVAAAAEALGASKTALSVRRLCEGALHFGGDRLLPAVKPARRGLRLRENTYALLLYAVGLVDARTIRARTRSPPRAAGGHAWSREPTMISSTAASGDLGARRAAVLPPRQFAGGAGASGEGTIGPGELMSASSGDYTPSCGPSLSGRAPLCSRRSPVRSRLAPMVRHAWNRWFWPFA